MIEKIFKAYDVRATYPSPLNEEMAWTVGHATAQFLKRSRQNAGGTPVKMENTVVVGRDMRPHSPDLAKALSDGLRSVGMDVIDVGVGLLSMHSPFEVSSKVDLWQLHRGFVVFFGS